METQRAYLDFKRTALELSAPITMAYWSDMMAANSACERLILPLAAQAASGALESLKPSPTEISGWRSEVDPSLLEAGRADRLSQRQIVLGDIILSLLAVTVGRIDRKRAAIAVSDRLACLPTTDYARRSRLIGAPDDHRAGASQAASWIV